MQHRQAGNMYGSVNLDNPDDESSSSATSDATTSVAAKTEEKAEASAPASAPVPAPVPADDSSDDSSEQVERRVRRKKGKGKPMKKNRKGAANLVQVIRDGTDGAERTRPTGRNSDVHVYTCGFEDFDLTAKTWNHQSLEDGIRSRTSRDFHADIIMDCSDLHKGKRNQHVGYISYSMIMTPIDKFKIFLSTFKRLFGACSRDPVHVLFICKSGVRQSKSIAWLCVEVLRNKGHFVYDPVHLTGPSEQDIAAHRATCDFCSQPSMSRETVVGRAIDIADELGV